MAADRSDETIGMLRDCRRRVAAPPKAFAKSIPTNTPRNGTAGGSLNGLIRTSYVSGAADPRLAVRQAWLFGEISPSALAAALPGKADRPVAHHQAPTDLPDGLIFRNRVKPSLEKYFALSEYKSVVGSPPSRSLQEGRIAIVTDVGRGMRWTRGCSARLAAPTKAFLADERSRAVPTPRCWRQVSRMTSPRGDGG